MTSTETLPDKRKETIFNEIEIAQNEPFAVKNMDVMKLMQELFFYPYGKAGFACKGLLDRVEYLLRKAGVTNENIRIGQIVFLSMSSILLCRPFSIILRVRNDRAVAENLISICSRMIPKNTIIQLQGFSLEDLYGSSDQLQNKVLICKDMSTLKKIETNMQSLIVDGRTNIQTKAKSKYQTHLIDIHISGPVVFIGIESEDGLRLLDHPSILRIQVNEGFSDWSDRGEEIGNDDGIEFDIDRIADYVKSFDQKMVAIPYQSELSAVILKQKPTHFIHKRNFLLNLIAICTILNNPTSPNMAKFIAKAFATKEIIVREWLQKNIPTYSFNSTEDVCLTAYESEYSIVKKLLNDILPIRNQQPSSIRCQIFEKLKRINYFKLISSMLGKRDILEELYTLSTSEVYWAKLEEIFRELNRNRSEIIPLQIIENELTAMKKMNLIGRKKVKEKSEYGYFISVPYVDKGIKIPKFDQMV